MILATAKTLKKKTNWVYVLACQNNTYYVGFSRFLHHRLKQHFAGFGAYFTRLHKPLRLLTLQPARDERDEFAIWTQLARKYGTKRVGGYSPTICKKLGFRYPSLPWYKKGNELNLALFPNTTGVRSGRDTRLRSSRAA